MNPDSDPGNSADNKRTATYLIILRELAPSETNLINIILANKAFIYSLILKDTTRYALEEDFLVFIFNINLRYSADVFRRIIIDIDINTKSTAGYG
jgi:hypothetical protein